MLEYHSASSGWAALCVSKYCNAAMVLPRPPLSHAPQSPRAGCSLACGGGFPHLALVPVQRNCETHDCGRNNSSSRTTASLAHNSLLLQSYPSPDDDDDDDDDDAIDHDERNDTTKPPRQTKEHDIDERMGR